jgi:hypothetical protein
MDLWACYGRLFGPVFLSDTIIEGMALPHYHAALDPCGPGN